MKTKTDKIIFLLPIAFAIHNLEEVLRMESWSKTFQTSVTTEQFSIAVSLFTILAFVLIYVKKFYRTEIQYFYFVSSFAGMLFLNVFFPHLIASIYFKQFSPGVVSALLINLPLSGYLLWLIFKSQKLKNSKFIFSIIWGGIIGAFLAFAFLKIGQILTI